MTFPASMLVMMGPGLGFASGAVMASNSVEKKDQGVASSTISLITTWGVSLGMAMAGNLEMQINHGGHTPEDKLYGYRGCFWLGCAFSSLAVIVTAILSPKMR